MDAHDEPPARRVIPIFYSLNKGLIRADHWSSHDDAPQNDGPQIEKTDENFL